MAADESAPRRAVRYAVATRVRPGVESAGSLPPHHSVSHLTTAADPKLSHGDLGHLCACCGARVDHGRQGGHHRDPILAALGRGRILRREAVYRPAAEARRIEL